MHFYKLYFFCLCLITFSVNAETIKLYSEENYDPLSNKTHTGLAQKIVKAAYKAASIEVEFISLPFARLLKTIKYGNAVGGLNLIKTGDANNHFVFPKSPIYTVHTHFYFKKNSKYIINQLTDLDNANIVIGQVNGFMYSTKFNERKFSRYKVQTEEQLVKMLWLDRVDGIYITKELMEFYCKNLKISADDFYFLPNIGKKEVPLYVAFNNKNLKAHYFASKFDEGLAAIKLTEQYTYILKNQLK